MNNALNNANTGNPVTCSPKSGDCLTEKSNVELIANVDSDVKRVSLLKWTVPVKDVQSVDDDVMLGSAVGILKIRNMFDNIDKVDVPLRRGQYSSSNRLDQDLFWATVNGVYNSPGMKDKYKVEVKLNGTKITYKDNELDLDRVVRLRDDDVPYNKRNEWSDIDHPLWDMDLVSGTSKYSFTGEDVEIANGTGAGIGINNDSGNTIRVCNNPSCPSTIARLASDKLSSTLNEYGFMAIKPSAIKRVYGCKFDYRHKDKGGQWKFMSDDGRPYVHPSLFDSNDIYPIKTMDEVDEYGTVVKKCNSRFVSALTGHFDILKAKARDDFPDGGLLGRLAVVYMNGIVRKYGRLNYNDSSERFKTYMTMMASRVADLVAKYYDLKRESRMFDIRENEIVIWTDTKTGDKIGGVIGRKNATSKIPWSSEYNVHGEVVEELVYHADGTSEMMNITKVPFVDDSDGSGDNYFDDDDNESNIVDLCPICGSSDIVVNSKTPKEFRETPGVNAELHIGSDAPKSKAHECVYKGEDVLDCEDYYPMKWIDPETGKLVRWTYNSGAECVRSYNNLDDTKDGMKESRINAVNGSDIDNMPDKLPNEATKRKHKEDSMLRNAKYHNGVIRRWKDGKYNEELAVKYYIDGLKADEKTKDDVRIWRKRMDQVIYDECTLVGGDTRPMSKVIYDDGVMGRDGETITPIIPANEYELTSEETKTPYAIAVECICKILLSKYDAWDVVCYLAIYMPSGSMWEDILLDVVYGEADVVKYDVIDGYHRGGRKLRKNVKCELDIPWVEPTDNVYDWRNDKSHTILNDISSVDAKNIDKIKYADRLRTRYLRMFPSALQVPNMQWTKLATDDVIVKRRRSGAGRGWSRRFLNGAGILVR